MTDSTSRLVAVPQPLLESSPAPINALTESREIFSETPAGGCVIAPLEKLYCSPWGWT